METYLNQVPWPQGMEAATASVAQELRLKYDGFFAWLQTIPTIMFFN